MWHIINSRNFWRWPSKVINYDNEVDHDEEPANIDEDAGVGEDDGEEAESIAACWDHHQSLSPTNPNEDEDEDEDKGEE